MVTAFSWVQRVRTEWPWGLGLFAGGFLVVLVRLWSNLGDREPLLTVLIGSLLFGSVFALIAALPFWALRRWVGPAGALALVVMLIGSTPETIGPLTRATRPPPDPGASLTPERSTGRLGGGAPPRSGSIFDQISLKELFADQDLPVRVVPFVSPWDLGRALRETMRAGTIGVVVAALALTLDTLRRRSRTRPPRPTPSPRVPAGTANAADLTRGQRRVVWLGIGALVVMLLFPPWIRTFSYPGMRSEAPAGYAPIFAPPRPRSDDYRMGVRLDLVRLLIQIAIVGLVAGALYWHARAKPSAARGSATHPRPSNPSRAAEPRSVPPDVSPTMATFFDGDRYLLPEFVPYRKEGLLAVEPESLLPVWWPEVDAEGDRWSPRKRVQAFEAAVRTCMGPERPREPGAGLGHRFEATQILAALHRLRSFVTT